MDGEWGFHIHDWASKRSFSNGPINRTGYQRLLCECSTASLCAVTALQFYLCYFVPYLPDFFCFVFVILFELGTAISQCSAMIAEANGVLKLCEPESSSERQMWILPRVNAHPSCDSTWEARRSIWKEKVSFRTSWVFHWQPVCNQINSFTHWRSQIELWPTRVVCNRTYPFLWSMGVVAPPCNRSTCFVLDQNNFYWDMKIALILSAWGP